MRKGVKTINNWNLNKLNSNSNLNSNLNNQKIKNMYSEIIDKCCFLYNNQLKTDYENFNNTNYKLSLVAKWIPREKSKFRWLFYKLAELYFSNYIETAKTAKQLFQAKNKCYCEYRKIISFLNHKLDTLQIKQCSNNWSNINFNNITYTSMIKQKNALLNTNKFGGNKYYDRSDRFLCASKFRNFIDEKKYNFKSFSLNNFAKNALSLINIKKSKNYNHNNFIQCFNFLNEQWENSKNIHCKNNVFGNIIPIIDTSKSMKGFHLHTAIALGIRIAELSSLGKRLITFSDYLASWINLENSFNFVDCVQEIYYNNSKINSNFVTTMSLIFDMIVENNLSVYDVENMVLLVLSDMQIDEDDNINYLLFKDIQ